MDTPDIDIRLKRLSHSSRTTLHGCPRKYQLSKCATSPSPEGRESVTFAYGHSVGMGVQSILEGKSWTQVVWDMYNAWDHSDIMAEEEKSNKSFFRAVFAVQSFNALRTSLLGQYELAYFQDKPAVELSFKILLPNGFEYRGYVDVVLRHRTTGKYLILELKTTGSKYVAEATYKNSGQALGYSIILDNIAPGESEYEVQYLVYKSTMEEYESLKFKKSYSDRAFWIKDLMMDADRITYYVEQSRFPTYGEHCHSFFKDCEFLSNCTMSDRFLLNAYDPEDPREVKEATKEYTIVLTLMDLIQSQLTRPEIQL